MANGRIPRQELSRRHKYWRWSLGHIACLEPLRWSGPHPCITLDFASLPTGRGTSRHVAKTLYSSTIHDTTITSQRPDHWSSNPSS